MDDQIGDSGRTLRNYPISLRQSARAVYGSAIPREEKRDGEPVKETAVANRS